MVTPALMELMLAFLEILGTRIFAASSLLTSTFLAKWLSRTEVTGRIRRYHMILQDLGIIKHPKYRHLL
jgi:hypothetical protein